MQLSIDLRRVNTDGETPDVIEKGWLTCFDGQPAYVGIPLMVVVLTTSNILSVNVCNALWKTEFIGSFLYLSSGIGCTLATRLRFGYSRWYVPIAIAVAEASTCWWFTGDGFAMVVFAGVNVMKAIKIREALQKYYANPKALDEEDVAKAVGLSLLIATLAANVVCFWRGLQPSSSWALIIGPVQWVIGDIAGLALFHRAIIRSMKRVPYLTNQTRPDVSLELVVSLANWNEVRKNAGKSDIELNERLHSINHLMSEIVANGSGPVDRTRTMDILLSRVKRRLWLRQKLRATGSLFFG